LQIRIYINVLLIGEDHPTLKEVLNCLKPEVSGVAAHWYDLGVQLLNDATGVLDVIKANHPNDANQCCTIMFEKWLMMKPDASWSQLVTALTTVGLKSSAANLIAKFRKGIASIYIYAIKSIYS